MRGIALRPNDDEVVVHDIEPLTAATYLIGLSRPGAALRGGTLLVIVPFLVGSYLDQDNELVTDRA